MVFDVNQNGIYNAPVDGIDSGSPGFSIASHVVGGEVYPINRALVLMPWLGLGLVLLLATGSGALILSRRRIQRTP